MATLRRIVKSKPSLLSSSTFPSSLLISCRGITTRLFVGGMLMRVLPMSLIFFAVWPSNSRVHFVSSFGFIGLSFHTTENGLSEAFSQCGQVIDAKIIKDRVSYRSKGFGFITFASEDEASKALNEMNGKALNGRVIFVDYAKPKATFDSGIPIARGPPEPMTETDS